MKAKQFFQYSTRAIIALLVTVTIAAGFTACSEDDNPANEPKESIAEAICGPWYVLTEFNGSLDGLSCRYVGQAAIIYEDGTGIWYFFMLNDAMEPLYVMGGKDKPYGHFHYTLANDGTISIQLDTDPTNHVWTMKYQNGKIIAPIKPSVVNSQAEARSVTRGEEATDVVELTSATDEELTRIQSMDATVYQPTNVHFSLKDTNGNAIKAKELNVSINGGHYNKKTSTASNEFTIDISPVEGKALILSAINGDDTYVTTIKDVTFEQGKTNNMEVNLMKVSTVQLWKNGPHFANMNLGATKVNDCGLFYAWSATTDFKQLNLYYAWKNLPYLVEIKDNMPSFSKYFAVDGAELEPSDDAASVNWGGTWRMPRSSELKKLVDPSVCSSEWKVIDDIPGIAIPGYEFTGATKGYKDKSIFLPAGGYYIDDINFGFVTKAEYWSAAASGEKAYMLYFAGIADLRVGLDYRSVGCAIRPVK